MFRGSVSLRLLSGLIVVIMGVLGMSLALLTGEIYHRTTLENQRRGLSELAGLAVHEALAQLEDDARSLGLSLQSDPAFEKAFAARDFPAIEHLLDEQFHQFFVTAGEIRLLQLRLYDPEFELLAAARDGEYGASADLAACPGLLDRAARRTGPQRLQFISSLCSGSSPIYSLIVPTGGLRVRGYVEVVADPAFSLEKLEQILGMPLRLATAEGAELYRSEAWPRDGGMDDVLSVEFPVRGDGDTVVIRATLLSDVGALRAQLRATRRNVLFGATAATLLVAAVSFWMLRHTTLQPIAQLLNRVQSQRENPARASSGSTAPRLSAVKELLVLKNLYDSLDQLAYTDPLTLLPNRAQFRASLEHYTVQDRRHRTGFALFIMDLNGFKQVNDRFSHNAGDELLYQVACRLAAVMRTGDVLRIFKQSPAMRSGDDLLARLGGDEFGALLPAVTSRAVATIVAEKLLDTLRRPFDLEGGQICEVGLSIGIAFYPSDATDTDTLADLADKAMYRAKSRGGGYVFAHGATARS